MKFWSRSQENEEPRFHLNPILEQVGTFGKFQKTQIFLLWLIGLCSGSGIVSYAFTGFVPSYRCLVPQCENVETASYYENSVTFNDNWSNDDLVFSEYTDNAIYSIPNNVHKCLRVTFKDAQDSCENFRGKLVSNDSKVLESRVVESCSQDELIYDKKLVESSFVTRFGFVCDNFSMQGLFKALVMAGMLVGSFPVGYLSDKVGRKPALGLCIILLATCGVINAWTTSTILFGISRLIVGMAAIGVYYCNYVIVAEGALPKDINKLTKFYQTCFPVGNMLVPFFAYFFRNERDLQLMIFAPILLLLIPWFFVKESTRWMISHGHVAEAKKVVKEMATANGKIGSEVTYSINTSSHEHHHKKAKFSDLFGSRKMALRTLNCCLQWTCVTATFYGLAFGSTSLTGNPYSNFALTSFISVPSILFTMYTFDRIGRCWSLIICQITAGICCIVTGCIIDIPELGILQIILVLIGKVAATITFMAVIQLGAEMYPTPLRSTATGTFSSCGRVGGIYALTLASLKSYWARLPPLYSSEHQQCCLAFWPLLCQKRQEPNFQKTTAEALEVGKHYKLKPCCRFSDE